MGKQIDHPVQPLPVSWPPMLFQSTGVVWRAEVPAGLGLLSADRQGNHSNLVICLKQLWATSFHHGVEGKLKSTARLSPRAWACNVATCADSSRWDCPAKDGLRVFVVFTKPDEWTLRKLMGQTKLCHSGLPRSPGLCPLHTGKPYPSFPTRTL